MGCDLNTSLSQDPGALALSLTPVLAVALDKSLHFSGSRFSFMQRGQSCRRGVFGLLLRGELPRAGGSAGTSTNVAMLLHIVAMALALD